MIGVVDYGGTPLFVMPTPGEVVGGSIQNWEPVVDIDEAANGEPFIWENWSTYIFPGFYETMISGSTWLDDWVQSDRQSIEDNDDLSEEDRKWYIASWDEFEEKIENKHPRFWTTYDNMVAKKWCELLWDNIQRWNLSHIITSMEYDHLWSPAYYNFATDRLNLRLTANWDNLEEYIQYNLEDFEQYLLDNWTSYDGFLSYVPNDYDRLKASNRYRTICVEYLLYEMMKAEENDDDNFYRSVRYKTWEWLTDEVNPWDVVAEAEKIEKEDAE